MKKINKKVTENSNVTVSGCTFHGPVWDKDKMVALTSVAKGLEHLAALLNHEGMTEPLIKIGLSKDEK